MGRKILPHTAANILLVSARKANVRTSIRTSAKTCFYRPFGAGRPLHATHGLRRGLHSSAASRLGSVVARPHGWCGGLHSCAASRLGSRVEEITAIGPAAFAVICGHLPRAGVR